MGTLYFELMFEKSVVFIMGISDYSNNNRAYNSNSCAFINYVRKTWVHVVIRRSKLEYNQEPISQITLTIEGKCAIC